MIGWFGCEYKNFVAHQVGVLYICKSKEQTYFHTVQNFYITTRIFLQIWSWAYEKCQYKHQAGHNHEWADTSRVLGGAKLTLINKTYTTSQNWNTHTSHCRVYFDSSSHHVLSSHSYSWLINNNNNTHSSSISIWTYVKFTAAHISAILLKP